MTNIIRTQAKFIYVCPNLRTLYNCTSNLWSIYRLEDCFIQELGKKHYLI